MFVDGNCRNCGRESVYYCDCCGLYFCEDHLNKIPIPDSPKYFIVCDKCKKDNKKPIDPYRIHNNPEFK